MPRLREMFSAIMYIAYSMKKTQNGENLIVRCVNCSKNILKYRVTDLKRHKQIICTLNELFTSQQPYLFMEVKYNYLAKWNQL